jgi:hypothetical protein
MVHLSRSSPELGICATGQKSATSGPRKGVKGDGWFRSVDPRYAPPAHRNKDVAALSPRLAVDTSPYRTMSPSRAISAAGTLQDSSSLVSILAPRMSSAKRRLYTAPQLRQHSGRVFGKNLVIRLSLTDDFANGIRCWLFFLRTARARGFFANGNAASDDHRPIPRRHGTTSGYQSCHSAQDAVVRTLVTGSRKSRSQRLNTRARCARKTPPCRPWPTRARSGRPRLAADWGTQTLSMPLQY